MRIAYLFVAAALAACGSSGSSSSAIPSNVKGGPKGPAPKISWETAEEHDRHFGYATFPYVSRDGTTVIIAQHDGDGGRGYQNLRFIVKNRQDRQVAEHVVLTADEYEEGENAETNGALIPTRVQTANAWLVAQHDKYDLVALPKMTVEEGESYGESRRANNPANSTTVELGEKDLRIAKGAATLVSTKIPKDWFAPEQKLCTDCEPCSNPHFLRAAAVDPDRAIAVVTVAYTGTDSCWEPSDQQRVVSW
ncbi:MAG: hypothetical protein KIT31_23165 [Deltaproteobacteria bacterium]|nr:hypothetical protein [Deltaproteobacteria bacterium]